MFNFVFQRHESSKDCKLSDTIERRELYQLR